MIKKSIVYDYNYALTERLRECGGLGVSLEEIESYRKKASQIHEGLASKRKAQDLPFYELPYRKEDLAEIKAVRDAVRKKMGEKLENVLIIGIGGSSLGGIALTRALLHPFHNLLPKELRKTPRLFFVENIDPDEARGLFDILDPEKTLVNIISKSGDTAEPLAKFLIFFQFLS